MRSKIADKILAKTPKDIEIFARTYGDIVVRINSLLKEKGMTQKELAEQLNKKPSEISKWLKGEHNFTLRSIAKLEAELGEPLLYVPKTRSFTSAEFGKTSLTVHRNIWSPSEIDYSKFTDTKVKPNKELANVS